MKLNNKQRKERPLYSGLMRYFPDALMEVSRLSQIGNDQHNPGEPLHWAREKSDDHLDCMARHLLEAEEVDKDGVLHLTKAVWRGLAYLQLMMEQEKIECVIPKDFDWSKIGNGDIIPLERKKFQNDFEVEVKKELGDEAI